MDDTKRIDDNSILGNEQPTSANSSAISGANSSDETNLEHPIGEEAITYNVSKAINNLPNGCNVYYGNYIDNYNGSTRRRYYLDSYGQLILTQTITNVNRPNGLACMTEMPMSHNMDVGIVLVTCCAAGAIALAVKFVLGRIIK